MFNFDGLGVTLIFMIGCGSFLWGTYKILRTGRILASGGIAIGEPYQARYRDKDTLDEEVFVSILFWTDQKELVDFEQMVPVVRPAYRVFYDKAKPERATVFPWLHLIGGSILTGIGAVFVSDTYLEFLEILLERL